MGNLINMLIKLEKRIIALEMIMKITPPSTDLLHPKAWKQAEAKIEAVKEK